MEISLIPTWIIKYFSSDFFRQNDINILVSNLFIILFFLFFGHSLISFLDHIPHFCLFDKILGVECPVCGITRSICEISKGNFIGAYNYNLTGLFVAAFFVLQIPLRIVSLVKIKFRNKIYKISKYFAKSIIIIILANWVITTYNNF